mgnify:FL=1
MPFSLRLAFRYLYSPNKGGFSSFASWLAIGGLSIGITALMLTASIIHGFQTVLSEKLSSLEGVGRIQNILGQPITSTHPILDSLTQIYPNRLHPYIRGVCIARSGDNVDGMIVEGVKLLPKAIDLNQGKIKRGNLVIGKSLAQELKVNEGDKLYLQVFSSGLKTSFMQKIKSLTVKKIYHTGLQDYDKTLTFMNLDDARELFEFNEKQFTGLIINDRIIYNEMPEMNYPFHLENWQQRHTLLFQWIKLQKWPAYIMFGLIAMVGIVNIISAIAMIIIEKSRQIGILIAQGTPKEKIKNIFILQGSFIGLMGAFLGGCLSMLIIWLQLKFEILSIPSEIYFMDQIPFSFDFPTFGLILVTTLILSLIASWWPTKFVMSLRPTVALRYE